ncbi:MAG: winged helix-turn-helix transcriptional regulator [Candidatus Marinimicrobia bacterium]|nr:winged helix-turn-helix transcriptional regulator [Candidatus Neomarinimicrobiota bacterium]
MNDNRIWPAIIIFILLARSQYSLGNTDTALSYIQKALSLAEPGGFILSFVQEGKYILPLLQHIREDTDRYKVKGSSKSFLIKLMTLIEVSTPVTESQSPKEEILSDRELEVLNCLAQGMTNSEIADSLFISLNTVRTHTKNIYDKLNVHSRTQAAARGKELGLI